MCSVKADYEKVDRIMHNVIAFYQGGIPYGEAEKMPLPRLFKAEEHAARIADENRKAANKKQR